MEQEHILRNTQWNTTGTSSLKALANKVLERNTSENKPGTETLKSVPHPDQPVPRNGTNSGADEAIQYDALSYEFEERAATAEYDGQQTQRIAYLDVFMAVLSIFPYEEEEGHYDENWLTRRVKATQNWLAAQGLQQPK